MSSPISPIPPPRRKSKSRQPVKETQQPPIMNEVHPPPQEPAIDNEGHPDLDKLVQNPAILTEVELETPYEEVQDKQSEEPAQKQIDQLSEKETEGQSNKNLAAQSNTEADGLLVKRQKEKNNKLPKEKHSELIEKLPRDHPKLASEQHYEELSGETLTVAKALESAEQNPDGEEITQEQKSVLKKVLAEVKKAKDDVKNRINKSEEQPKDISSLENGRDPGETSKESEQLTTAEKFRRSMQGGLEWLRKIYGDAVACVDKTDKQNMLNKKEAEQPKNGISPQSNVEKEEVKPAPECAGVVEDPGEMKNVASMQFLEDKNAQSSEKIENVALKKLTLAENAQQSGEVKKETLDETSSFKYCEYSGEIKNVALPENSIHQNGALSEESKEESSVRESQTEYLLGYCEKSGELKNMAIVENGLGEKSGKFQKVLETVDQVLDGPTPEEMEEVSSKFSATKVQTLFKLKVYLLLTCQLSIAIVFISVLFFLLPSDVKDQGWLMWLSIVISVVLTLPMLFIRSLRTDFPINIFILALLTIIESIMFGMITAVHDARAIFIMFILTAGVVIIFAVFTVQTKVQYTNCNVMVTSLSFIITTYIIFMFATPLDWFLPLTHGAIAAFLFSLWVAFDIKNMVEGSHIFIISPDQYVFASLALQLFILHGFVLLLKIIRWTCDKMCAGKPPLIFGSTRRTGN